MEFLLVHSPLVGPATWRWIGQLLSAAGHDVAVPDLRAAAQSGRPQLFVDETVAATPPQWHELVVVGHSGTGFFLPSIAGRLGAIHTVFVDAGLPPETSPAYAAGDFFEQLAALAVDGALPRWSTWWGDEAMKTLVPDDARRHEVEGELAEVPLSFYETPMELPADWQAQRSSFLLLSEAYRADADRARSLGWAVTERLGGHLDIVTSPETITPLIVDLATTTEPR